MFPPRRPYAIVVLLALSPLGNVGLAHADPAEQAVGLFAQACLRFAGDAAGLRRWAGSTGLRPLPPAGQKAFLQGRSGIAFDASNATGKFVLISGDDGTCSTVAERAERAALVADLERSLSRAGLSVTPAGMRTDPEEPTLHYTEFVAHAGSRTWRLTVATGEDDAHPMMTARPE